MGSGHGDGFARRVGKGEPGSPEVKELKPPTPGSNVKKDPREEVAAWAHTPKQTETNLESPNSKKPRVLS